MRTFASTLARVAAALVVGLLLATTSRAETSVEALARSVAQVEEQADGRSGVSLIDTGSTFSWFHRADERFLMNSTVKVPICGAVAARIDAGTLSLADELPVREADILSYAPATKDKVGQNMTIADLCLASIDMSDNTAANLLIDHLGGPQAVTQFFRSIGDSVSRLDRREPESNSFAPGDPRDTTTPAAMAQTLRALLLGDAVTPASREKLAEWMRLGGVTQALLRNDAPQGWEILDKSGSGSHTRNIVAVVSPEGDAPWIVTIFVSEMDADFDTRNAVLQKLGTAVIAVIRD